MLNQKCLCLPLWVWLLAFSVGIYYICYEKPQKKSQEKPKTIEEKKEKFSNAINSRLKIFNFNTEWCGYSKKFQPIWNDFSDNVKDNMNIKAIDVKCDNDQNKDLCNKYNIKGFPTVIIVKNNEPHEYSGNIFEILTIFVSNLYSFLYSYISVSANLLLSS